MSTKGRVWDSIGEGIYTAVLLADGVVLALVTVFSLDDIVINLMMTAVLGMLGLVMGEWGKRFTLVRALIPVMMWYLVIPVTVLCGQVLPGDPEIRYVCFCYTLGLLIWDMMKKDVWAAGILFISAWMLTAAGHDAQDLQYHAGWETAWGLLIGVCGCQLVWRGQYRKAAAAIMILMIHGLCAEGLVNTLILEGVCLAAFLLAQKNKNEQWTKAYGCMMLITAVYMMRELWTAVAWWVYLLIAGIGLIIFAAVREKND